MKKINIAEPYFSPEDKERINNEYPKYCNYYQTVFADLIGSYRNSNLEYRDTEAPTYFNEKPIFVL